MDVFELDQAKALKACGHDVRIATLDLRSIRRWRSWRSESFTVAGIPVYTVNFPCGRVPGWIIDPIGKRAAKKACALACADGWNPDIIHAHFTDMAYFFSDVAAERRAKYVVTEHNSALCRSEISKALKKQALYAYSKADVLFAVSSMLKSHIKKHTGYDAAILPNVVDTQLFSYRARQENEDRPFCFLSASALSYGKGMDLVLKAFSLMKDSSAKLTILGDGAEMRSLQHMAKELNIIERVSFQGRYTRAEFNTAAGAADCFVLASRLETFGVVYIEALASGLPVIATRCGGPEDFVNDKNGVLVPVDDVDALAEAMQSMIHSAYNYSGEYISRYVFERFSTETIAQQLTKAYEETIKNTNAK